MNEFLFLFSIYTYYVFKSTKIVMRLMKIWNNQNCFKKIFGLYQLSVDKCKHQNKRLIKGAYCEGNCNNYLKKAAQGEQQQIRLQKLRHRQPRRQPQQ
jgi:hypothetical protein